MGATLLYDFVGRVFVYVGGAETPDASEWDTHIRALRDHVAAHADCRSLVWAGGAKLSPMHRKQLADALPKASRAAVITASMIDRGIVTALTWFVGGIKAFSPEQEREALAHLQLRPDELGPVLDASARLRRQMAEASRRSS